MTPDEYPPIAAYAIIGCTRSAALVSSRGSIDWLAWPRFDSPSIFARILDHRNGGCFAIRPAGEFTSSRRYLDSTNVLETTFTMRTGVARLLDLMPVMTETEKRRRLTPYRQLLRRIEVVDGEVPIEVLYAPRPDYARTTPRLERRGDMLSAAWGAHVLHLRSEADLPIIDRGTVHAAFTLRRGESRLFALSYDDHTPAVYPHLGELARLQIDETIAFWKQWSSQLAYRGPYRGAVGRSVLALKLLTYAPSGAVVAAATTSLPERIGGVRNWDYRYCWLRDASFTVSAFYDCGFEAEGAAFVDWLLYSTRLTQPKLQMLYNVFGEADVPERELPHLEGYRGSKPVRIGNGAARQFQLDIYGEVLGAIEEAVRRGEPFDRAMRQLTNRLARVVAKRWREPDDGIWEKRAGRAQHIHAKVMAWSALDCADRLTKDGAFAAVKEEIRDYVLSNGFDAGRNTFVGIAGEPEVDASLLYVSRVGLLPPDDPRVLGTIAAIRSGLGKDELIYRYDTRLTEDGLPEGEGAFLACSFWLAEALALAGRDDEARDVFEKMLRRANDVGLYSEEIDVASGELLGNFPQALTHIALINAALCFERQAPRVSAASRARR
jgi:GH15 family glucan-1,4-alpha-glucosidase